MRRARYMRGTLGVLLAGWVGSAGCTHNHYYGSGIPVACAPGTTSALVPGSVQYGSMCEVPARSVAGGTVVSSPGVKSSVVAVVPPPSTRVVVSEPLNRPHLLWRRSDPESNLATTRSSGALDDDTTVK